MDAVRAVSIGQERLASSIQSIMPESHRQARMYRDTSEVLTNQTRSEFDEAFRATVLDPVARYGILFPETEDMIKSRDARLLDYDASRAKVRKSADKPSSDPSKLPKLETEEQKLERVYEETNNLLLDGIPRIAQYRIDSLEPSMRASLQVSLKYAEDVDHQLQLLSITTSMSEKDIDSALFDLRSLPTLNM